MSNPRRTMARRRFLGTSAAAMGVAALRRAAPGTAPTRSANEKLNIAGIGVGGMGSNNLKACEGENIVALCDVDAKGYAAHTIRRYPKAKVYRDYRVMLDKEKDIDAVIVATPDHSHAVIAMAAMQRGRHVYV